MIKQINNLLFLILKLPINIQLPNCTTHIKLPQQHYTDDCQEKLCSLYYYDDVQSHFRT